MLLLPAIFLWFGRGGEEEEHHQHAGAVKFTPVVHHVLQANMVRVGLPGPVPFAVAVNIALLGLEAVHRVVEADIALPGGPVVLPVQRGNFKMLLRNLAARLVAPVTQIQLLANLRVHFVMADTILVVMQQPHANLVHQDVGLGTT